MSNSPTGTGPAADGPSILDLLRLSSKDLLLPGGESVYREVARIADLGAGEPKEVLDVATGTGGQLRFLVREYGIQASGVDRDPRIVERAEMRSRADGLSEKLQFQEAPLGALPYRDEIFDVTIGELGLTAEGDPARALSELVRVTRPGGSIVLLQLVWKAPLPAEERARFAGYLGVDTRTLVEWKEFLGSLGVTDLHVTDWSDEQAAFRPRLDKPFPDFAEMFSLREKLSILRRARRIWGWSGVRHALESESAVHRLLTRDKTLGFVMIKGVRAVETEVPVSVGIADPVAGAELPLFRTPGSADPAEASAVAATPSSSPATSAGASPAASQDAPAAEPKSVTATPKPRRRTPVTTTEVNDLPLFSDEGKAGT